MSARRLMSGVMLAAALALLLLGIVGDDWPRGVRMAIDLAAAACWFLFAFVMWREWRRNA